MSKQEKPLCAGQVWSGWKYRGCCKTGSLEHEGKHYCKTHHPPTEQARNDARWAERKAEIERRARARREEYAAADEQKRRADCFDDLLVALKEIQSLDGRNAREVAAAAIAKATGAAQ